MKQDMMGWQRHQLDHFNHYYFLLLLLLLSLSPHADRQGVDISFTVCNFACLFFVCAVTDFSGEYKASGVKFCTVVHRRPGIPFLGNFAHRSPKMVESATHPEVKFRMGIASVIACLSISRGVWT